MIPETIPFLGLRHPVAAGTHFVAFMFSILGTWLLWRQAHGQRRIQIIAACYGFTMMCLYAASSTYHALQLPWDQLRFFLLLDKCAIYGFIAGTYTPVVLLLVPAGWRRILCITIIWLLAVCGIVMKVTAFAGGMPSEPYWIGALLYLGMGWIGLALIMDMVRAVGFRGLQWAIYGGLAYTIGVVIDIQHEPVFWPGVFGSHELFHVFTVVGTLCHFVFIWEFVLPYALRERVAAEE